jgi:hypothetical protein
VDAVEAASMSSQSVSSTRVREKEECRENCRGSSKLAATDRELGVLPVLDLCKCT